MRLLDSKYDDFSMQFNIDHFDQSEKLKQKFITMHDFKLDIDINDKLWQDNEWLLYDYIK